VIPLCSKLVCLSLLTPQLPSLVFSGEAGSTWKVYTLDCRFKTNFETLKVTKTLANCTIVVKNTVRNNNKVAVRATVTVTKALELGWVRLWSTMMVLLIDIKMDYMPLSLSFLDICAAINISKHTTFQSIFLRFLCPSLSFLVVYALVFFLICLCPSLSFSVLAWMPILKSIFLRCLCFNV